MKIVTFLLLAIIVMPCDDTIAQLQQWNAKFNGSANGADAITAMTTDAVGNVYVTGYAANTSSGVDYVTMKYNTAGVRQWIATYNGPGNGNDIANAICIDNLGNVYVTGRSDALTGAFIDDDAATIKYSATGQQKWVARYDGGVQRADVGRAIIADNAGNVYITGYTSERSGAKSDFNYLTVKYNASGVQQWAGIYNGPAVQPNDRNDSANAIGLDAAGNVYVTGMSNGNRPAKLNQDYLTVKYSAAGKELWTDRYNGPGNAIDEALALVTNALGDVYVTGVSTGAGLNDYDFTTIKYNTNGIRQWVKVFNDPINGPDIAFAIATDKQGNVYVTGDAEGKPNNPDIYTIKYNAAGNQQWIISYDGGDVDHAAAIALDKNNNIYVTGYSTSTQTAADMVVIKYNNSGVQQWLQTFKGSTKFAWDASNAVAVDTSNNVYIAGYTTNAGGNTDYTVIKYTGGSTGTSNKVAAPAYDENAFLLYPNSPNPFRNQTNISFKIQSQNHDISDVKLWIEDASGKLLNVLIDKKVTNGTYQVQWNPQHVTPGVYYYKLRCNQQLKSGTMIMGK
ncbi:MAG: SBBP repeat-containing protein [Bacteroidota bacterium]|nr:SBBP repeat-containing protein [Bacteroidota bacterium]